MDKTYDHTKFEEKIYQLWEKSGSFTPKKDGSSSDGKKPFTIIMPPPNANDDLHIGHARFVAIEDILTRYHRMKGDPTLWLPGADHAGIETQYVFEKKLSKEGKSRFDFDRQTLYDKVWDYAQKNKKGMDNQLKALGASCDWERYKFTLDSDILEIVYDTFIKLHKDGLIYRGKKLVNYCTKCGTSYSNLEVDYVERKDPLYFIKYGPFVLATVRPETKFGDTAVCVNPGDKRYKDWVGREIEVDGLIGKFKIKVIADNKIDPQFGTGVAKVTPAHDFVDFEIGQRHNLEIKQVINFDGKLNSVAGIYKGLGVSTARKIVAADLAKKGLLVKIDKNYRHTVGVCYRCKTTIEPLPLVQWFVKVQPLAKLALLAIEKKDTSFAGPRFGKIARNWLENLNDWNISRQIVWGIRIPVWYSIDDNPELEVVFLDKNGKRHNKKISELVPNYKIQEIEVGLQSLKAPENAKFLITTEKPGDGYLQETDTFDTWFSSGQWPFATLKTAKRGDFAYFYPTSVMNTGYDILPFWVIRMLMLGIYATGATPFRDVLIHGLVRDKDGLKISKSKGNVINPLEMVQKYGADALRVGLVWGALLENDISLSEENIRGQRNFSNKIWNVSRFVFANRLNLKLKINNLKLNEDDSWILKELDKTVEKVTGSIEKYRLNDAAEEIYDFVWHKFADRYIEKVKPRIANSSQDAQVAIAILYRVLNTSLRLLHPFMPFVTEAIWSFARARNREVFDSPLLITAAWPKV